MQYFLAILLLSVNLYIFKADALCPKCARLLPTLYQAANEAPASTSQIGQSSRNTNHTVAQSPSTLMKTNKNNSEFGEQRQQVLTAENLDNLRLEYNKFKILSHLGINSNPDQRETNDFDAELRYNLTSSLAIKESQASLSKNQRHKRSLACSEIKSDKDSCCLQTFYVNFTEIGWDKWILYPSGYNANYCRGQCDLSHARYYHSTLLSKFSHVIGLCCSPKQMAPLRLLYIDEHNKVHQKSMPDMVVESCDCA